MWPRAVLLSKRGEGSVFEDLSKYSGVYLWLTGRKTQREEGGPALGSLLAILLGRGIKVMKNLPWAPITLFHPHSTPCHSMASPCSGRLHCDAQLPRVFQAPMVQEQQPLQRQKQLAPGADSLTLSISEEFFLKAHLSWTA